MSDVLPIVITAFASFVAAYVLLELRPMKKMSVKKALQIVDHKELALEIPNMLKQHGWKYILFPDSMEQNIRGLVVDDIRNKYDKSSGEHRRMLKVIPLSNKKTIEWEWADFYDKIGGKLERIVVSDGTVIVPLSKVPNKYDYREDIAWTLMPPYQMEHWRREAEKANTLRQSYNKLRSMFDTLSNDYDVLKDRLDTTEKELKEIKRQYSIKLKYAGELEIRNERLEEMIKSAENKVSVIESGLEDLMNVAKMNGWELLSEKIRKELKLAKETKSAFIPVAKQVQVEETPAPQEEK